MPQDRDDSPQTPNLEGAKGGSVPAAMDRSAIPTHAGTLPVSGIRFAPIWAGFLVGLALYVWLGAIGLAMFATQAAEALSSGIMFTGAASGLSVWLAITALIALFIGAMVAAHLSRAVGAAGGVWCGVILWGLAFTLMYLLGTLASGIGLAATASTRATPLALSVAGYSMWWMMLFQFLGLLAAIAGGAAGAVENDTDIAVP